jgi:hypothetical protein
MTLDKRHAVHIHVRHTRHRTARLRKELAVALAPVSREHEPAVSSTSPVVMAVVAAHEPAAAELAGGQPDLERDRGLNVQPQEPPLSIEGQLLVSVNPLAAGKSPALRRIVGPLRQDAVNIRNAPGLVRRIGA